MSFHQFIAIGLSLAAVIISIHTKYKQRQKNRLRDLAGKLKNIKKSAGKINNILENPRSHEDLDLRLYEIPRELLACQYETEKAEVTISTRIETGYGENSKELRDSGEILNQYRNGEHLHIKLRVGNPDEFYASDRQFLMTDPFDYASYFYKEIYEVEEEFGDVIEEFNDKLFEDLESHIESMLKQHSNHLIEESNSFSVSVNGFESTGEMGKEIFKRLYYYEGLECDIDELENKLEELDEFRTTVLQTSYS